VIPPPLIDSPKCDGCSLSGICLPDETTALEHKARAPSGEAHAEPAVRRLHPARDDRLPLYVQEHSARIGLRGDCLVVKRLEGDDREVKLYDTSQVSVFGNAQLTTQAMRRLMQEGISVSFFSTGGKLLGRATGLGSNNVELRVAQYAAARDPSFCVEISRKLVVSKIRNCRTFLRRNHEELNPGTLDGLKQLARKASEAEALDSLLGIEGSAARLYFSEFAGLFSPKEKPGFDFHGRNRRPPRDPVNAMLSFAYALLTKDLVNAVACTGLDPLLGYYHQPRFGRPALALDLMEEFRPLVADSVVVAAVNNGILQAQDFHQTPAGVSIKAPARKRFIEAYERRVDQLVTHPVFGYRISYRRVLEVQARLLGRLLLGELEEYPTFQTR
jgi:CRISP-associated protein Cas1